MTEKRFVMRYGKYIDNVENIEYDEKWESWKIVELLNTLSEENEQLKKEKDYYKRELQKDLVCQAIIDGREKND